MAWGQGLGWGKVSGVGECWGRVDGEAFVGGVGGKQVSGYGLDRGEV